MSYTPTPLETEILKRVQGNLPDVARPFADVAEAVGTDEETVLELLRGLKDKGVIRRFGATLRHQKAGYGANAMTAWKIGDEERIMEIGRKAAENPNISHCYYRRTTPEWPYDLYTMIHGRSKEDCLETVKRLSEETGVTEYKVLFSIKELKKTSMTYF